jgi:tetratricopeptide (TPR) repeat protein
MPITTSSDEARVLFIEGRYYKENVQPGKADSLFRQAIAIDPDFALAYLYISKRAGLQDAISLAEKVSGGEQLMIKASGKHYIGDIEGALSLYDSLAALFPKDKHCLYYQALMYRYSFEQEIVISLVERILELDPYYSAAFNLLAYTYMDLQRFDEAKAAMQKYINYFEGTNINALDSYAEMLTMTGEYEEAIETFKRVWIYQPSWTSKYYKIAWNYIHLGKFDLAFDYCKQLYEYGMKDNLWGKEQRQALGMMATICFVQGDLEGALMFKDQVIQLAGENNDLEDVAFSWLHKGWYTFRGGDVSKGIKLLEHGLKLFQDSIIILENPEIMSMYFHGTLSVAYAEIGNTENSRDHLNLAEFYFDSIEPNDYAMNWMNTYRSAFAILVGDFDYAIRVLEPIHQYGSQWRFYLAKAYELKGDRQSAIKNYHQAMHQWMPVTTGYFYNEAKERLEALMNE